MTTRWCQDGGSAKTMKLRPSRMVVALKVSYFCSQQVITPDQ